MPVAEFDQFRRRGIHGGQAIQRLVDGEQFLIRNLDGKVDFVQLLQMADRLGYSVGPAVIYGVESGEIGWTMELSLSVAAKMPRLLELVVAEIERMLREGLDLRPT